jgi:hypothetical protein
VNVKRVASWRFESFSFRVGFTYCKTFFSFVVLDLNVTECLTSVSCDSSVSTVTQLQGSVPERGKEIFSSPSRPSRL